MKLFFCFLAFSLLVTYVIGKENAVPALYVFGDSTVDTGNHLPLENDPYGVDLDASLPRRWTNGYVISDFIALTLGLPLVPPYKDSELAEKSVTGINYAFGGAGILPETFMEPIVADWSFDKQIAYFNTSLTNLLNKRFSGPDQLLDHLGKSVFLISFGINDYIVNYISPYKNQSLAQPGVFAHHLLTNLSKRLTTLYRMGARKFVVNNIWPMGCMPAYHLENLGICNNTINRKFLPYAESLPSILSDLSSTLPGFDFSYSDNFAFAANLRITVNETGITNTTGRCWEEGIPVCPDRSIYEYFDIVHTTESVNDIFSQDCFSGTICFPKSISDLVLD